MPIRCRSISDAIAIIWTDLFRRDLSVKSSAIKHAEDTASARTVFNQQRKDTLGKSSGQDDRELLVHDDCRDDHGSRDLEEGILEPKKIPEATPDPARSVSFLHGTLAVL